MRSSKLICALALFAMACDSDGDGSRNSADCAPDDATISPDADELCDGVDNDCDGRIDEDVLTTFYADSDGDGFGASNITMDACETPSGFVQDDSDCDNLDPAINTDAQEVCDDVDNDCDGLVDGDDDSVDASTGSTYYADADADGYGDASDTTQACGSPDGYVDNPDDCNDSDPGLNPETTWYGDFDGDGFGTEDHQRTTCEQPEGYVAEGTDCDESDAAVNPAADEICDGVDNNCDDSVDENTAVDAPTWYQDDDGDGWGQEDSTTVECNQPTGYSSLSGDCDDTTEAVSPDADEICDGLDNDCDDSTDYDIWVPSDYGSIQAAIDSVSEGETFCVAAGTYTETLDFSAKSVEIVGAGTGQTILDAGYAGSVLTLTDGAEATLRGMDIVGGEAAGGAVAWVEQSSLVLRGVYLSDHWCVGGTCYGAMFSVEGGSLELNRVEISEQTSQPDTAANLWGGVVYGYNAEIVVVDSSIHDSFIGTVTGTGAYGNFGPFIYSSASTVDIDGLDLYDNEFFSMYNNEGLVVEASASSQVTIHDTHLLGNSVTGKGYTPGYTDFNGGFIALINSIGAITNSSMVGNEVSIGDDSFGAFAYLSGGELAVENVIIAGNTIQGDGSGGSSATLYGLFYTTSGELSVSNTDIYDNSFDTFYYGYSAVFGLSSTSSLQVLNSSISSNSMSSISGTKYASILYNGAASNSWGFNYSNLYDNSGGPYTLYSGGSEGDTSTMSGLIEDDPLYNDVSSSDATDWDLTLASGSPNIDAGDPELLDTDGTTSDIGAYGGPNAAW